MKITIALITLLCLIFAFLYFIYENAELREENAYLKMVVDHQSERVKTLMVDIDNYTCDIEAMQDYIKGQYKQAFEKTKDDSTCEAKLNHLENILRSYED